MVPPNSNQVPRDWPYSGVRQKSREFHVRGYHPVSPAFPDRSTTHCFVHFLGSSHCPDGSHDPACTTLRACMHAVWADPRSLAATRGVEFSFFSWRYLDVSVPSVPFVRLCLQRTIIRHYPDGVSTFGNLRIIACLAAPRSLSQPYHVLHRSLAPNHPPCTLSILTTKIGFDSQDCTRMADATLTLFICQRTVLPQRRHGATWRQGNKPCGRLSVRGRAA